MSMAAVLLAVRIPISRCLGNSSCSVRGSGDNEMRKSKRRTRVDQVALLVFYERVLDGIGELTAEISRWMDG